jgi:antitoxin YefM
MITKESTMISTKDILPVTMVKRELLKLVKGLSNKDSPLVITKDGKAAAVMMSPEEYESMVETIEVLSDAEMMRSIRQGQKDIKEGRTFSHGEVFGE